MKEKNKKTKKKQPSFEEVCEKSFKTMRKCFKNITWPARQQEIKSYESSLNFLIESKKFTKDAAIKIIDETKGFLFLYKMITGGELRLGRIPYEVELHSAAKVLKREINKKEKKEKDNYNVKT